MGTPKFIRTAGAVQVLDGTRKVFDTSLLPATLMPAAAITLSGYSLGWPDILKDNSYYHDSSHTATTRTENFAGFITALPQEWGPSAANVIADVVLGTVPAGADYLDIEMVINSRTKVPTTVLGDTLDPIIPVGKSVRLLGGSALMEEAGYFARGFAILIVGGNVVLRRYQSVSAQTKLDQGWQGWSASNSASNSGYFTYGSAKGTEFHFINGGSQTTTSSSDVWQRGSSNQLSSIPFADTTDYSSTYSVDLVITPGYLKTAATVFAPSVRAAVRLGATSFNRSTNIGSSFTWTSAFLGVPDATRYVLVAASGYLSGSSISGLTINGVAATLVKGQVSGSFYSSLWLAAVPSGTTGNIVISFSGSGNLMLSVAAFALYHLSSATPVATLAKTSSGSGSLANTNGGFAFACEMHTDTIPSSDYTNNSLAGLAQIGFEATNVGNGLSYYNHGFGFQKTTGATLSPAFTFSATGTLVAASFF